MKELSLIIGKVAVIVLLTMLPIVVSAVEYKGMYKPSGISNQRAASVQVIAPTTVFQSTSTLPGSGSALSATPMLGEDGTVGSPARISRGPRKVDSNGDGFDDETGLPVENVDNPGQNPGDQGNVPLGDAMLPLLLFACAYLCGRVFLKRKRALKG